MKIEKQIIHYNVFYYNEECELIDQTQIDENNEDLAWEIFNEFGHIRSDGYTVELIPVQNN